MTCWNQIGVFGDATCPELPIHIHCRECPTYREAALRLLDTPISDAEMAEVTAYLSREEPTMLRRVDAAVIFRVGTIWLALPATALQEIVSSQPIHSMPHRRNGEVLGLVNIRGELLVCVALRVVLKLKAARDEQGLTAPRMLVTQQDGERIVYPVDEVFGIERFQPQEYDTTPALIAKAAVRFTQAVLNWKGTPVSLLEGSVLLNAVNRSLALATAT